MVDVMRRADPGSGSYSHWKEDVSLDSGSAGGYRPEMYGDSHHSNGDRRPDSPEEGGPVFVLEHLATFTVSPEMGTLGPRDGMRRLLQMEKTTGIWTQKMELRLRQQSVVIVDHENGDLVERFPVQLIREPTAFTSQDPKELYNNIFIFIVTEDPTRHSMNPPEMHIFQCLRVSAQQLVEDVKSFMAGKQVRPHRLPPPPSSPPPEPPNGSAAPRREQMALFNAQSRHFESSRHSSRERERERERAGSEATDDVSSTSSEKYERDVAVLNHCFDDIEKFIARLQQAAVASHELEKRRKSRKAKKRDFGEGMLSMRAKPPPRRDFVEILQKFKLSFNLLAKLKAHIHDPNAPELVHFLFTPLALIVDASRDSNHGANLPAEVVAPLLTRGAIDLLVNCLTSKESELWHSLGEAWCRPRDQWEGHLPAYNPVFLNGWAPELGDERDRDRSSSALRAAGEAQRLRADKMRRAEHEAERRDQYRDERYNSDAYYDSDQPSLPSPSSRGGYRRQQRSSREERERTRTPSSERGGAQGARSDASADSAGAASFVRQQRMWLDELKLRGARIVQVSYPRTASNDKELTVTRGEYLEVIDDSRKWWRARNSLGQTAHVPHTIITPLGPEDSDPASSADWVKKEKQGKKVSPPPQPYSPYTSEDEAVPKQPPPPPTPPPPPPPPPPQLVTPPATKAPQRRARQYQEKLRKEPAGRSQNSDFDEELRSVLGTWRKNRKHLDILRTPDAALFEHSSPAEVQDWLTVKAFSPRVCTALKDLDGGKMFKLEKKKLVKLFGPVEGSRLYSQITVQKKTNGFNTVNTAELRKVLAKARQKADSEAVELPGDFDFGSDDDYDDVTPPPSPPPSPQQQKRKEKAAGREKAAKKATPPPGAAAATRPTPPAARAQLDSVFRHDSEEEEEEEEESDDNSDDTTGTLRAAIVMQRHQLAMRADKVFLPSF